MSTIRDVVWSRGGKLYISILLVTAILFFLFGYITAKNEAVPIIIEKAENR